MTGWVWRGPDPSVQFHNQAHTRDWTATDWVPIDTVAINVARLHTVVIQQIAIAPGLTQPVAYLYFSQEAARAGASDVTLESIHAERLLRALEERAAAASDEDAP